MNRLAQIIAPTLPPATTNLTQNGYDAHDNLTSVTDANGHTATYVYDGLDNLIQVTSPDTGTTVYVVDAAGNRTQATDAGGVVTNFTYDALNRLATKTFPADATENETYTYDTATGHGFAVGRLASVSDAAGTTNLSYDERGNVIQDQRSVNGKTYTTAYTYSLADRVTQITYPSGRTVTRRA